MKRLFVVGLLLFVIGYFLLRKRSVCATAKVTVGQSVVKVEISTKEENSLVLFAIALCYGAKIRWLILSEPEIAKIIFENVFDSIFDKWPIVPDVEMMASLNNQISQYVINLHFSRSNGWFVTNIFPTKGYTNDLITNYFFVLREIINKLNEKDLEMFREILYAFINDPLLYDSSFSGLKRLNKKVNEILISVQQKR